MPGRVETIPALVEVARSSSLVTDVRAAGIQERLAGERIYLEVDDGASAIERGDLEAP